jgi:menaquinone-dependent protoporphyrinogen IX oxidase
MSTKTLVVFHSAGGNTRAAAKAIAEALSADLEEIREVHPRPATLGGKGLGNLINFLYSGFSSSVGLTTQINPAQHEAADYDLVVVGTPVYAGSLPPPARTYLKKYGGQFKEVAFFVTSEDPEKARALKQMEQVCGRAAKATAAFRADKIRAGDYQTQVQEFANRL